MLLRYANTDAILHAGTPMIGIPEQQFTKVSTFIRAKHGFICDQVTCRSREICSDIDMKDEKLTFTLGGNFEASVEGNDLLISLNYDLSLMQNRGPRERKHDFLCQLAVFNADNKYILGNPLLKNYYAIYDMDN